MKFLFPQIFSLKHVVTSSSIWLYSLWHPFETIRDAGSYSCSHCVSSKQISFDRLNLVQLKSDNTFSFVCMFWLEASYGYLYSEVTLYISSLTLQNCYLHIIKANQCLIFFIASYSMWIDLWWYLIGSDLAVQSLNINMFSWFFLYVFTCIFVCLQSFQSLY